MGGDLIKKRLIISVRPILIKLFNEFENRNIYMYVYGYVGYKKVISIYFSTLLNQTACIHITLALSVYIVEIRPVIIQLNRNA